jgi:translation initiation factor 5B
LLTKKQKEEQRAAEIRKQALLASGAQIEGLHKSTAPSRRPVYGGRKKGGPAKGGSPAPDSVPQTPEPPPPKELASDEPIPKDEPEHTPVDKAAQDVSDDWDASSEDEKAPPAEVKESWDQSSEEDEEGQSATTPASKPTTASKAATKAAIAKGLLVSSSSSSFV